LEVVNFSYATSATGAGSCSCSGANILLPIELVKFNAVRKGEEVKVEWVTASEFNNNYFVVERSIDGNNFVSSKDKIKGAGNSYTKINYSYTDEHPAEGLSYYRLKQVDNDGAYKYSHIISCSKEPVVSKLNPNPAVDFVNFDFYSPSKATASIQVIDITGRVVLEKQQDIVEGNQVINTQLQGMEGGAYYFKISINEMDYTYTTKLIKN
jgi:hypothetical protein